MDTDTRNNKIALFDLDNTLLDGDSDYMWGKFLADKGMVDAHRYNTQNEKFYKDYREGSLDINEFLRFALQPLSEHSMDTLVALRQQYTDEYVEPMILPKALALIERHRRSGHELLIITATNRFVTEPIAARFGIANLLATEPEKVNGRFTGGVAGLPCFQEGKIQRFHNWLLERHIADAETWFYSDSYNDLPLLSEVDHPVAVDADARLADVAKQRDWQQISLR